MKKYIFTICRLFFFVFIFIACNNNKKRPDINNIKELKDIVYSFENPPTFRKDGTLVFENAKNDTLLEVNIEIATNDKERARGLMYRPQMDKRNAMLFIMDKEEIQSFWMHNTIISLDIIYINSNFEIVDIHKNTKTQNNNSLPSAQPAKYVLEVNSGICEEFNINIGDKIKIN